MEWVWDIYGEWVYIEFKNLEKFILQWCEDNEFNFNCNKWEKLVSLKMW